MSLHAHEVSKESRTHPSEITSYRPVVGMLYNENSTASTDVMRAKTTSWYLLLV